MAVTLTASELNTRETYEGKIVLAFVAKRSTAGFTPNDANYLKVIVPSVISDNTVVDQEKESAQTLQTLCWENA